MLCCSNQLLHDLLLLSRRAPRAGDGHGRTWRNARSRRGSCAWDSAPMSAGCWCRGSSWRTMLAAGLACCACRQSEASRGGWVCCGGDRGGLVLRCRKKFGWSIHTHDSGVAKPAAAWPLLGVTGATAIGAFALLNYADRIVERLDKGRSAGLAAGCCPAIARRRRHARPLDHATCPQYIQIRPWPLTGCPDRTGQDRIPPVHTWQETQ